MLRTPWVCALALAMSMSPMTTWAAPTTTATGNVKVTFDPDAFSFRGGLSENGITETIPLPPGAAVLSFSGNRATLSFDDGLFASAFFTELLPISSAGLGAFDATFNFTAQPGWEITGYQLSAEGVFDVSPPGSVALRIWSVGASLPLTTAGRDTAFLVSGTSSGAFAPALQGDFEARATTIGNPASGSEFALGASRLVLHSLSIEAITRPVPEPATWTLLAAGFGVVAGAKRRRTTVSSEAPSSSSGHPEHDTRRV